MGDVTGFSGTRIVDNCSVTNCEVRVSGSLGEYYDGSFGSVIGWIDEGVVVKISNCTFSDNKYVTDRITGSTADLPLCGKYDPESLIIE